MSSQARARRTARTKGKTESDVKYVKSNALAGRAFEAFHALEQHLREWMFEADRRVHGTTFERPIDRFERDEEEALRPLPALPLPARQQRTCSAARARLLAGFAALYDDVWQSELNLNLLTAVRLDRALLPSMLAQARGVIVHVTSIQHVLPLPESTAAKAALSTYSKALSNPQGGARGAGVTGMGRDRGVRRPRQAPRRGGGHRLRGRHTDHHELARRHPTRPARATTGGGRPHRVPRVPRASAITGTEVVIDGGTVPTA
jgi:hypothetical protein